MVETGAPQTQLEPLEPFFRARGLPRWRIFREARSGYVAGVPVVRLGKRLYVYRIQADRILSGELPPADRPDDSR